MRGFLAFSIGIACTAALVLPLSLPSGAAAVAPRAPDVPGSTQSLPLAAIGATTSERSLGPAAEQGLTEREVRPFSLLGVVWDDVNAELHGTVQVRTRAVASGAWSGWQGVETHNADHRADPGTRESEWGRARGATAPLWVGASDGVEVRVRAQPTDPWPLPEGLSLELVDPGEESAAGQAPPVDEVERADDEPTSTEDEDVLPALSVAETEAQAVAQAEEDATAAGAVGAVELSPYIGPRPRIITRKGWGASESLREPGFVYTNSVKVAFVHHTATGNSYTCEQAPSVLRSIYRYHVVSSGWRDFGYNFAVDKCGNIYEGRAGGVAKPVLGAHTLGFNTDSMGIAVLGTYSLSTPPAVAVDAVAQLTAWKLGLYGIDPRGKSVLTSGGSGKYEKGKNVSFNAISGHRDGFFTECPGSHLYARLGTARTSSATLQGRT
ncbi:N-acetylmuramoyl-L-alanine amidase [Streptomyces sp. NPDC048479]|uniref:N-acetylmuramoyl-L-alanine amidase n=1 Tax=Streptomyces sp. NPDC048479 TaxID=3154725 RepID=UPI00342BFCC8